MSRERRSVVVTGGSTGIGLAVARRFAQDGDRVLVTGRTESTLQEAQSQLADEGLEIFTEAASVANTGDVRRVVDRVVAEFGGIDVLINNAGVSSESPILETSEEMWDELNSINLKGVFLMSREVGRSMVERDKGGVILVTSSINSLVPVSPGIAYGVTKAGVDALVKGLAVELASSRIRVCSVNPGYIETPLLHKTYSPEHVYESWVRGRTALVPMKRLGDPSEIANVLHFLASEDASYITGTQIIVDGGRLANAR
jgi:3-oxoacyl-[acyl-carrier protein] reductase